MRILTLLFFIAVPAISGAHHSATQFDDTTFVEIDGIVVDVFWRNPHVVIKVAADEDNPDEVWELEGSPPPRARSRPSGAEKGGCAGRAA